MPTPGCPALISANPDFNTPGDCCSGGRKVGVQTCPSRGCTNTARPPTHPWTLADSVQAARGPAGYAEKAHNPPRHDHLLDDFGFVIHHKVGITFHHGERLVSEEVGNFEQRGALRREHGRRAVAEASERNSLNTKSFSWGVWELNPRPAD